MVIPFDLQVLLFKIYPTETFIQTGKDTCIQDVYCNLNVHQQGNG